MSKIIKCMNSSQDASLEVYKLIQRFELFVDRKEKPQLTYTSELEHKAARHVRKNCRDLPFRKDLRRRYFECR